MNIIVQPADRARHAALLDQMFRGRAAVFKDRLNWPVTVRNGWETDQFDDENPTYLISIDEATERVRGSMRLLPTTGPTLLNTVFASEYDTDVDIQSATIWEATRFCIHPDSRAVTPAGVSLAAAELMLGLCELGLAAGFSGWIAVYDERIVRVHRRIGWVPTPLATSRSERHGRTYVGIFDVSPEALERLQAKSKIFDSTFKLQPPALYSNVA